VDHGSAVVHPLSELQAKKSRSQGGGEREFGDSQWGAKLLPVPMN